MATPTLGGTRMKGFLAALLLLTAQTALAQKDAPPSTTQLAAKVDEYLDAALRHDQFSGSILIARDGQPVVSKGYGMANYELGVPNTPDTAFRIASLTKQFTAMAIMQLQEKDKLKVSDPICKYVADCPASWQQVTLRHLLTHSSGIKNYSSLPNWDEVLGRKYHRRGDLVDLVRDLPLDFAPGEQYKYSNTGYQLLSFVIEGVSGKSYGTYLHDEIFAPLGMKQSRFENNRAVVPGLATGYDSRGTEFVNAPIIDPSTYFGDGGIITTTRDLLAWDQALYTDKLISKQSMDLMHTPYKKGYGFGWQIGEKQGRRKFDHSGSDPGYSAYIARYPDDRVTVIVLGNSDRMSAYKAGMNLASIAFGDSYKLPQPQLRDLLWDTIVQKGMEAAKRQYQELQRTQPAAHDFSDEPLVHLGYDLIDAKKFAEAAELFKFTLEVFPKSAYSYDGLADIAIEQGDKARAVAHFEKSLSLDPSNKYAVEAIERLRGKGDGGN